MQWLGRRTRDQLGASSIPGHALLAGLDLVLGWVTVCWWVDHLGYM